MVRWWLRAFRQDRLFRWFVDLRVQPGLREVKARSCENSQEPRLSLCILETYQMGHLPLLVELPALRLRGSAAFSVIVNWKLKGIWS